MKNKKKWGIKIIDIISDIFMATPLIMNAMRTEVNKQQDDIMCEINVRGSNKDLSRKIDDIFHLLQIASKQKGTSRLQISIKIIGYT